MMKKMRPLLFAAFMVLSLFQPRNLHAESDYKWNLADALSKNDYPKVHQILDDTAQGMTAQEKKLAVSFVLNYSRKQNALDFLRLFRTYGLSPSDFDLFTAIDKSHSDGVVQFILDEGVKPNGEILLIAAEKKRFNLVNQFTLMGAGVNYVYPQGKNYSNGMSALLYAAEAGSFDTVKILVERGANVNVRSNAGYTAAAIAQEKGHTAIYHYLKEHGALDIDLPRTAAGQAGGDAQGQNGGGGIAGILDSAAVTLQNGTYRLSGSRAEITLTGTEIMGRIQASSQGKPLEGSYRIEKNTLIIYLGGRTYTYAIDSPTSFSGNGEKWNRSGK